jgi:hypothetical protein
MDFGGIVGGVIVTVIGAAILAVAGASWRYRDRLTLPLISKRNSFLGWRARRGDVLTKFGGWLYVLQLHIINKSDRLVSLRPYVVVQLQTPTGPSPMTLSAFDLRKREHDPWTRHNFEDVHLNLNVELLEDQLYWLSKDVLTVLREEEEEFLSRPLRLQPNDEVRGKLAFFLWVGALPRTGAGFADKRKPGVLVSDRPPPIDELVLEDALNDDLWKNPHFVSLAAAFSDLRAPWPPKL